MRAPAPLRPFAFAVLLAAALSATCGDEAAHVSAHGVPASSLTRPALRTAAGGDQREPIVVGRFDALHDGRTPPTLRIEPLPFPGEETPMLRMMGREKKTVQFALEPRMVPFDRIVARIHIQRADALEVSIKKGGTEIHRSRHPLVDAAAVQDVEIQLAFGSDTVGDTLALTVRGEGPAAIGRVDLVLVPPTALLPAPGSPAEFVAIGQDERRVIGVTSRAALETSFDVGPDAELGFAYGIPANLRIAGPMPMLAVDLIGKSGHQRLHRLPFGDDATQGASWHQARLPLEDFDGERVTARIRLESGAEREAVCAVSEPKVYQRSVSPPTVLLITSDTHRGDHVGAAGLMQIDTPTLDALAKRGVLFERCFSSTNVTLPSHSAILTGVSPRDTGVIHNQARLAEAATTLAERFREAGFVTYAAVSASHLDAHYSGLGQGFDRMAVTTLSKRGAGETIAVLESWLDESREKPMFVWLHLFDAHMPYAPPAPLDRRYYPAEKDPFDPALPAPADPRLAPPHLPGLRDFAYAPALYSGEVTYLDGELLRLLSRKRFREGVVAFTADHGESLGAHGIYWDHAELYPDSLHVPLILAWPGAPAGARVSGLVNQLDLGRTLLDLAGARGAQFPGRSLLRHIGAPPSTDPVFALSAYGFSASMTAGRWHLILELLGHAINEREGSAQKVRHAVELYDLQADPHCEHDLAGVDTARAKSMRAELVAWLRARTVMGWNEAAPHDAATLANLESLGYAGSDFAVSAGELFPAVCRCEQCAAFR